MLTEQVERNFLPEPQHLLHVAMVPALDTLEMIDNMEEGKWEIPTGLYPYATWLDELRGRDKEELRKSREELVADWLPLLDRAEDGYRIAVRVAEEHVLRPDLDSIQAFNLLFKIFRPSLAGRRKEDYEGLIVSTRKAFLYLLSDEKLQELGLEKPESIDQEDIDNAKHLVVSLTSIALRR